MEINITVLEEPLALGLDVEHAKDARIRIRVKLRRNLIFNGMRFIFSFPCWMTGLRPELFSVPGRGF